jgi:hypothetical protein
VGHRHRAAGRRAAFGDADQGAAVVPGRAGQGLAVLAALQHPLRLEGQFRQQDHIGPTCDAALQRDPPRIAPHGLHDHHPAVAAGGGSQPAQGFGHHRHRAVEAEGALGQGNVVIDGLGHADHGQSPGVQP